MASTVSVRILELVCLGLWLYGIVWVRRSGNELAGVAWSNIWFSGLLTTSCYGGARLAVRWAGLEPAACSAEERWRGVALGAASIWCAFYLSWSVQLVWYALAQPWVDTPRPF